MSQEKEKVPPVKSSTIDVSNNIAHPMQIKISKPLKGKNLELDSNEDK